MRLPIEPGLIRVTSREEYRERRKRLWQRPVRPSSPVASLPAVLTHDVLDISSDPSALVIN
ncbi:hypothetical protein AAER91_33680, partial [Klebsiella pneumoniae]